MPRTPGERLQDPAWWGEQALHAVGAWPAVFVPFWGGWGLPLGALVGLYVQGRAEWEQRPVESWFDLAADLAAAGLGGIAYTAVGWLIA